MLQNSLWLQLSPLLCTGSPCCIMRSGPVRWENIHIFDDDDLWASCSCCNQSFFLTVAVFGICLRFEGIRLSFGPEETSLRELNKGCRLASFEYTNTRKHINTRRAVVHKQCNSLLGLTVVLPWFDLWANRHTLWKHLNTMVRRSTIPLFWCLPLGCHRSRLIGTL